MKFYKKLVGEKVYLTPLNVECAEIFTEWLNDIETTDYIGRTNQIYTLNAEKKYLEENIEKDVKLGIVDLETETLIGTISLENLNGTNRTATLGIFIGDKSIRSKGYGTESIKLLLDFGFNYMNLKNIQLDVLSFNERAIKCYKKSGFKEYGRRRESVYCDGEYCDVISMDILQHEFTEKIIKNRRKIN